MSALSARVSGPNGLQRLGADSRPYTSWLESQCSAFALEAQQLSENDGIKVGTSFHRYQLSERRGQLLRWQHQRFATKAGAE